MHSVKLYVYDLSQGLAKILSRSLIQKQIDGIWHTAVVVYDIEFYFGQGILTAKPGSTHHGAPVQVIDMGETEIPPPMFKEFLDQVQPQYTPEKYNLLHHNCNNFTNEVCEFLVGKPIPEFISNLPSDVLSTPFGKQFEPMLKAFSARGQEGGQEASNLLQSLVQRVQVAAAGPSQPATDRLEQPVQVIECRSLQQFNDLKTRYPCIILYFTNPSCPPCIAIAPEFERLAINYNEPGFRYRLPRGQRSFFLERKASKGRILLPVKVETGAATDLALHFQITATPTFISIIRGEHLGDEIPAVLGANKSALDNLMLKSLNKAYPPHAHSSLKLTQLFFLSRKLEKFHSTSPIANILKKLKEFVVSENVSADELDVCHLEWFSIYFREKSLDCENFTPEMRKSMLNAMFKCLQVLPIEKSFPVLDLFRLLVLDPQSINTWILDEGFAGLHKLFLHMEKFLEKAKESLSAPDLEKIRPTFLMYIRLATNLIQEPLFKHVLHAEPSLPVSEAGPHSHVKQPYRSIITGLLALAILSDDMQLMRTAIEGGFWNLSCYESMWRDGIDLTAELEESIATHVDWIMELQAAVLNVIQHAAETIEFTVENLPFIEKLVASQGHLLLFAEDNIIETCLALDLPTHLETLDRKLESNEKLKGSKATKYLREVLQDSLLILSC